MAKRNTVIPAMPFWPVTPSHCSGVPTLSSTITQCGPSAEPAAATSMGESMVVGLDPLGGAHGPRPLRCSSASSASSSSVGEAKTNRRSPQASNISSCWLCGSHTNQDHNSGWRVTTISLMSLGLW